FWCVLSTSNDNRSNLKPQALSRKAKQPKDKQPMNESQIQALATDLSNWLPLREMPEHFPQFKYQQLKQFLWHRESTAGLNRCARLVGRKLYVCAPLFGAYLAGMLPEQAIAASTNRRETN
ncbi:MAG: hypothetical protein ACRC8Q_09335, partial [Aeromonas sp.]